MGFGAHSRRTQRCCREAGARVGNGKASWRTGTDTGGHAAAKCCGRSATEIGFKFMEQQQYYLKNTSETLSSSIRNS